jgi:quercetin dioxygenase-like cupin family protein
MEPIDLRALRCEGIRLYQSVAAAGAEFAAGAGEAHLHCVRFEPGGAIGPHEAGFGQLFLVVEGRGWVSDADGRRVEVSAGQGALLARGELHAKGSDTGMTALMVQVRELAPRAGAHAAQTPRRGA